jgi:intein/homing endonuclease
MKFKEKIILSQKDLKLISKNNSQIIVKAKYGPSKPTAIPLGVDENFAFLVASIIGDGHIKKSKFQIAFECTNPRLNNLLKKICKEKFNREFNIKKIKERPGKKPSSILRIDSKAICKLLEGPFEIPRGKKSHLVKVPKIIKESNKSIKIAFLKGILATEGGKRRRGYGLSTASKELWLNLIEIFKELNIPVLTDKWTHQSYKKDYYGISFKECHLKRLNVGVPEWSNGMRLGRIS